MKILARLLRSALDFFRIRRLLVWVCADDAERAALNAAKEGFLAEHGWPQSVLSRRSIGSSGEPIPWVSYAFLTFITPRLGGDMSILEFGVGASTLFYAGRVAHVTGIEDDREWLEEVARERIENVSLVHPATCGKPYWQAGEESGRKYDIIIVDGKDRVKCIRHALPLLKTDGVLILDDSDREEYGEGIAFLRDNGLRQLDFQGMGPVTGLRHSTSVFYRDANCLGI